MKPTLTDVHLGNIFYAILLNIARQRPGQAIRYKELLQAAREAHPHDEAVQSSIPVSMGRRLEMIVRFLAKHNLPPLTCIVVNETGRPGASYKSINGSWQADMDAVSRFDWSTWERDWAAHVEEARKAVTPLKRRTDEEARVIVHAAYKAGTLPRLDQDTKERLVGILKEGRSLDEALVALRQQG